MANPVKFSIRLRNLAQLGLPTFVVWLLTFEWITRAHATAQILIRVLLILLGILWIALRFSIRKPIRLGRTGILLFLYLILSFVLVPFSPLPFHGLEVVLSYILYFLFFIFFLNDVRSQEARNAWVFAFIQAAILFSIFNLSLVGRWWLRWLETRGDSGLFPPFGYRLPGLFLQHPNVEAAFLNLILPFLFVGLLRPPSRKGFAGRLLLLSLFLLSNFFASSRGAWLGTVGSLGVVVILLYWDPLTNWARHLIEQRKISISPRTLAFMVVGIIGIGAIGFLSYQQARFGGHGGRWGVWQIGWRVYSSSPILGHGPGSFHVLGAVEAGIPPGFYLVHAHNLLLQILAETGVFGLMLIMVLATYLSRQLVIAWRKDRSTILHLIPILAALAGMLTHQLVDFAFESPLYTIGIIFHLAVVVQAVEPRYGPEAERNRLKYGLLIMLIACYAIGSVFTLRGSQAGSVGVEAAMRGEWEVAQERLCEAREQNPWSTLYTFECGFASALSAAGESETIALAAYAEGLKRDPYWAYHLASKASLEWRRGERDLALGSMLAAKEQAPRSFILAYNLAKYYFELGEESLAKSHMEDAHSLNPWLWLAGEQEFTLGDPLDEATLTSLQKAMGPTHYQAWLGWINLEYGTRSEALAAFETALEYDPLNIEALAGLSQIALEEEKLGESQRLLAIAELTGRSSWVLSLAQGDLAIAQGDQHRAHSFWIDATHKWFWTASLSPYFESVYSRAYIPIDFPPQIYQPKLPDRLHDGFQEALINGSPENLTQAQRVIPWMDKEDWLE